MNIACMDLTMYLSQDIWDFSYEVACQHGAQSVNIFQQLQLYT